MPRKVRELIADLEAAEFEITEFSGEGRFTTIYVEMTSRKHFLRVGCLVLAIFGVGLVVWIASNAVPQIRYNHRSRRINEKIHSLRYRRPANVSDRLWTDCVAWASIAHCNICFSEEHTSYAAMCRFEEQLDDNLQGEVDVNTIAWIGERLSETGPHGRQYMTKWREQWKSVLQAAGYKPSHSALFGPPTAATPSSALPDHRPSPSAASRK